MLDNLPRGRTPRILDFIENVEEQLEKELKKLGIERMPEISPVIKTSDEVKVGSLLFLDIVEDVKVIYDES